MNVQKIYTAVILLLGLALVSAPAGAQTSVALSVFGALNGGSTGHNTIQSPANALGGMAEVRHFSSPLLGYEATYSYFRANQAYSQEGAPGSCPSGKCISLPAGVSANAHEITGDWLPSLKMGTLRLFGVFGAGALMDVPVGGMNSGTSVRVAYVYGAGVDWAISHHIGALAQFRGNLYKAPKLSTFYPSTGTVMQTAEPMLGIYYRF